jgi:hypothetical protein
MSAAVIGSTAVVSGLLGYSMATEQFVGNFQEHFRSAKTMQKTEYLRKYGGTFEVIFNLVNEQSSSVVQTAITNRINPLQVITKVFDDKTNDAASFGRFNSVKDFIHSKINGFYSKEDTEERILSAMNSLNNFLPVDKYGIELFNANIFKKYYQLTTDTDTQKVLINEFCITKMNNIFNKEKLKNFIIATLSSSNKMLTSVESVDLINELFKTVDDIAIFSNIEALFLKRINKIFKTDIKDNTEIESKVKALIESYQKGAVKQLNDKFSAMSSNDFRKNQDSIKKTFSKQFTNFLFSTAYPNYTIMINDDLDEFINKTKKNVDEIKSVYDKKLQDIETKHTNIVEGIKNNDETILMRELINFLLLHKASFVNINISELTLQSFDNFLTRRDILIFIYSKVFKGAQIKSINENMFKNIANRNFLNFLFYCISHIQMNEFQIN